MSTLVRAAVVTFALTFGFLYAFDSSADPTQEQSPALAADSPKMKPLILKELIQQGLDNNYDLKAAKFEALGKEAQIGPAGSYEDPMLSFAAQNYPVDTLSANEYSMTGNQFGLSQKIPFPGKLSKLRRAAAFEYESKKELLNGKQLDLIKEIRSLYYGLYLAYKKRDVLNEHRSVFKQLIGVTRSRVTLGRAQMTELINFQIEEANVVQQLLGADTQIRTKIEDLRHALGHKIIIEGRPEELTKTGLDLKSLSEAHLVEKVLTLNPQIKAMKASFDSSDQKNSYAKLNYLPDFEFGLAYTLREPGAKDRGVSFISGKIGLTLPLWAANKQSEQAKGATAERNKAEAEFENEKIHMLRLIHTKIAELDEESRVLQLYQGNLMPLAKQAVRTGQSAYLTDKANYSTLLTSINSRFKIEYAYNEALVNYEMKIAEIEAIIGEPLAEAMK